MLPGVDDYRAEGRVAVGTVSRVYRAVRCADGARVILKRFQRVSDALHEARVYETLRGIDGVLPVLDATRQHIVFPELPASVMPLDRALMMPHSLRNTHEIATSIARVLTDIHARSVVHRDLKEDNILVDTRNWARCWIIDFHMSDILGDPGDASTRLLFGLRMRTPPEHLRRSGAGLAWDVWQFGVLLARLEQARLGIWPPTFPLPPMPARWDPPVLKPTDRMLLAASHEPPRPPSYRLSLEAYWIYHCLCEHDPSWIPMPEGTDPRLLELMRSCTRSSPYDRPLMRWTLETLPQARPRLRILGVATHGASPHREEAEPASASASASAASSGGAGSASGEGSTRTASEAMTGPTRAANSAGSDAAKP